MIESGGVVVSEPTGATEDGPADEDGMVGIPPEWLESAPLSARAAADANPAVAREVYKGPHAGALDEAHAEEAGRFYSLSLSGNSARAIVRGWLDQSLLQARQHVREWFEDLEIRLDRPLFRDERRIAEPGTLHHRWPLWQLVTALQGKGESAKEQIIKEQQLLWECALAGNKYPMPMDLLLRAVSRIGSSGDLPPARAALIRCVLNRLHPDQPNYMKKELDLKSESAAYQCGRLLRVLARIQVRALSDPKASNDKKREVNAGIIERFYSGASTMPGLVLGPLIAKAQNHLAKIENLPEGGMKAANAYRKRLREICTTIVGLNGFPQTNNPIEQGEFALGFYFQGTPDPKEIVTDKDKTPSSVTASI